MEASTSTLPSTIEQPLSTNSTMIPIHLTTRLSKYTIPNQQYMIPSDWKRYQLSELLNKVLEHGKL